MPQDWKARQNAEPKTSTSGGDLAASSVAAEHLGDFDVEQVWRVERLARAEETGLDGR